MTTVPSILGWMSLFSDPTRVRALRLIERQEISVAELCDVLQLPQSTVSRHLKVLGDYGWLLSRREGTSRFYYHQMDKVPVAAQRLWALLREQLNENNASRNDDARLESVLAMRQTRSQEFFASSAGQWDKLREELFGVRLEFFVTAGLLDESWVIGDLGCGTGGVAEALAPFVRQVVALDNSTAMIQAARKRTQHFGNVEVRRGQMEALPIDDQALDAVFTILVLHHLAEPMRAISEMARVLKPGGKLLILDMQPHDRQEYRQQMGHVWLGFSSAQLEKWLTEAKLGRIRWCPLPPTFAAKGPPLMLVTARKN